MSDKRFSVELHNYEVISKATSAITDGIVIETILWCSNCGTISRTKEIKMNDSDIYGNQRDCGSWVMNPNNYDNKNCRVR